MEELKEAIGLAILEIKKAGSNDSRSGRSTFDDYLNPIQSTNSRLFARLYNLSATSRSCGYLCGGCVG